ncbi:MAG: hypothetical protein AB7N54_07450 [Alphaproteobacteria bacterium]
MYRAPARLIRRPNDLKLRAARPGGRTLAELRAVADTALADVQAEFVAWVVARLAVVATAIDDTRPSSPIEAGDVAMLREDIAELADSAATFGHPVVGDVARMMGEVVALATSADGRLGNADRRHVELLRSQVAAIRAVLNAGPGAAAAGAALLPTLRRTIDRLAGASRA